MPEKKKSKDSQPKEGNNPEGLNYDKNQQLNPTQSNLAIDRIEDGFVYMKNGGIRIIMMVSSINFSLKNQEEQNAIIGGYQSFLNALSFPIQIVVQSRRLDLTTYLQKMEKKLKGQSNQLLKIQMADYIDFISRLIKVANIMDKKFYVVVPYDPVVKGAPNILDVIRNKISKNKKATQFTDLETAKKELRQRAGLVASGLSSIGIRAVQLNTQELVELLYTSYNPASGQLKKIGTVDDVLQPVIEEEGEEDESK